MQSEEESNFNYLKLVENILKELQCLICHDTVKTPVIQCKQCSNLFCEECIDAWKKQQQIIDPYLIYQRPFDNQVTCPVCKKAFKPVQSKSINNILQLLPQHCSKCEVYIKEQEIHNKICPHRDLKCQFFDCKYEGSLKNQIKHVITSHYSEIKDNLLSEIEFEKSIEELDNLEKRELVYEMKINDQTTYSGQVLNGVPYGVGLISSNERKQFAFFKNGKPIVFHSITEVVVLKDQKIMKEEYFGFINAEGLRNGIGKLVSTCGQIKSYEGMFNNGQFDGFGKIEYHSSSSYEGQLKEGKKEGFGKLTLKEKYTYIGNFKDDYYHGDGKLVNHENATFYSGNWQHGKRHGCGTALFSNGAQFVGVFEDGQINGDGVVTSTVSQIEAKGVYDSLKQGNDVQVSNFNYMKRKLGTFDKYRGQVRDFYVFHGKGEIQLYELGLQFRGMFKNGIISGQGTITDTNEEIEIKGLFDNLSLKSGTIQKFTFKNKNQSIQGTGKGLNIYKLVDIKENLEVFLAYVNEFKGTYTNRERGIDYEMKIDYSAKNEIATYRARSLLVRAYLSNIKFRDLTEVSIWSQADFLNLQKQKSQIEELKESYQQPLKPREKVILQKKVKFEDNEKSAFEDDEEISNIPEKDYDSNQ